MQVFNVYMKVLKKKLSTAFIYLAVFLTLAVFMPSTAGGGAGEFSKTRLDICVFDEDDSPESRALVEHLKKEHKLVALEKDKDVITDALYYGRADYVMSIKEGYGSALGQGETDGLFENYHMHDGYAEAIMRQELDSYVGTVISCRAAGEELTAAIEKADSLLSGKARAEYVDLSGSKTDKSVYYYRYLAYVMIAVVLYVICEVTNVMNGKSIRSRTDCSGLKRTVYTLQMFLGSVIVVTVLWLIFNVCGILLFGKEMTSAQIVFTSLNSFIFALVCLSAAMFISEFSPGETALNLITQIISLGMSFLCGIFVEMSVLSESVLMAGRFLPAYWYVKANDTIMGGAFDSSQVLGYMAVEMIFAVFFFTVTMVVSKVKK